MLSEREQRTLDEIEMHLVIEDPRFGARMGGRRIRLRVRTLLAYVGVLAVVTIAGVSFAERLWIVGSAVIGAGMALGAGYGLASWQHRRRLRRDARGGLRP